MGLFTFFNKKGSNGRDIPENIFVEKENTPTDKPEEKLALTISEASHAAIRQTIDSFNPFYFFTFNGTEVPALLAEQYALGKNSARVEGWVKKDANNVVLHIENEKLNIVQHFEFALDQGGSLKLYYQKIPKHNSRTEWSFEKVQDVWVPKTYHLTFDAIESEMEKTIEFIENQTNAPIRADLFTLEAMGVRKGAYVSDNRLGTTYHYGGRIPDASELATNLKEAEVERIVPKEERKTSEADSSQKPIQKSSFNFLYIALLAVLVAGILVFALKSRSKAV